MKKLIIVFGIVIFLGLAIGGIYYFTEKPLEQSSPETQTTHSPCLEDDEFVDYYPHLPVALEPVTISVKDKNTNQEKFSFQIKNVRETYYIIQPHKCGVYVIREFNYNPRKTIQDPGYKEELWRYDYTGKGESLLLLAEKPKEFISYYSPQFRVDPREIYVALIRGYFEREDYALIIKDLNFQSDSFILAHQTLLKKYPELFGYFGLEKWTKNGEYFWGDLSIAANEIAYLRILRDIWKLDVLPAPGGTLGGTAFNPEFGYVTYDTGPGWIGIDIVAEQIYDDWRKEGKKIDFYLYNLFTKEKTLLATIDDPSWSFKPQWLSDTELQYELPTGEKKIYRINE